MRLLISERQLLEVANKMFQGEFDDFVYSQEFLIGQLKSMIKERKSELDKLIQRLKKEEKLIPKVRFNVDDNNGFAQIMFFNPETEKMENKNTNPLQKYFRQPKIYIKLPSNGKWYPNGSLEVTDNMEFPVYAMTARDELMFKTPDALLNGQSTVDVIQSCVPSIKNAWDNKGGI